MESCLFLAYISVFTQLFLQNFFCGWYWKYGQIYSNGVVFKYCIYISNMHIYLLFLPLIIYWLILMISVDLNLYDYFKKMNNKILSLLRTGHFMDRLCKQCTKQDTKWVSYVLFMHTFVSCLCMYACMHK